jgi:serine/threonine protein kinase
MQGYMCHDVKSNNVRIIDYIKGDSLFQYIPSIKKSHLQYFNEDLPEILKRLLDSIQAIQFLHSNKLCHGDIRNDHIYIERETGLYRWIDFDLKQDVTDFDLWSMGNILSYVVGKGIITFSAIQKSNDYPNEIKNSLAFEDSSAFYSYRIMNLKKIFPYIPDNLSTILRKFTIRPLAYYINLADFIHDYKNMLIKDFNIVIN